jgi:hypothetical protein
MNLTRRPLLTLEATPRRKRLTPLEKILRKVQKRKRLTKKEQAVYHDFMHNPKSDFDDPNYDPSEDPRQFEDRRRKPGSVKNPGGHQPHMGKKLLPGEAELMSKKALGFRSHQQRLNRSKGRVVVFSNGIATKRVSVVASTDKLAEKAARKKVRLTKAWKVIRVEKTK